MAERMPREEWFDDAFWIALCTWVALGVGLASETTPTIVGGQLFVAGCAAAMGGIVVFRAEVTGSRERWLLGALFSGMASHLFTIDWSYVVQHGVVVNSAAVGGLVGAFILGLRRR